MDDLSPIYQNTLSFTTNLQETVKEIVKPFTLREIDDPTYYYFKNGFDFEEIVNDLNQKGYYVWYFKNRFPRKNRTFYYLVYATQNLTGFKIMKEVIFKEESRRYFEPNLFKKVEFTEFEKTLLEKYKGNKLPRNDVLAYVLQETNYLATDLDSVIKKV